MLSDVIWLELMFYQKEETLDVWCEPGVSAIKFENLEIKVGHISNKFLKGNQNVEVIMDAGREKESTCIKHCKILMKSGLIS